MIERSSITLPYPPPGAADPRSYHLRHRADGGHGPFGGPVLCTGVVVFAHVGVKVAVSSRRNAHFCFRTLNLPCRGSSCLIWPISSVFKNEENARTIRSKRSEASGRCAKTPHVRFVLCFTAQTGLRAQKPQLFKGFHGTVPGPPKRPPKRLPGARAPKKPPRAPQDGQGAFSIVFYRANWPQVLKT